MDDLVLLRWIVPTDRGHRSGRGVIVDRIAPVIRAGGWLRGPGTTHHVTDRGDEAWLTVVGVVDKAPELRSELEDLLAVAPVLETGRDVLLHPDGAWYRVALQHVTHASLDVLDARAPVPLSEYVAFEDPSQSAMRLLEFLGSVSDSYRRCWSSFDATERFWLDFFRPGPDTGLERAGRSLWNLAG